MSPNTERTIPGYISQQVLYTDTSLILQPTDLTTMKKDLNKAPMLLHYKYRDFQEISIVVSNVTNRTIVVQPKAIICEIQSVNVESIMKSSEPGDETGVLDKVNINMDTLSESEIQQGKGLLHKYSKIFSKIDLDSGFSSLIKHRVDLTDERPFKHRYRKIPPRMYVEVRNHLQQILDAGIIRRSHSPFASNIVLVMKKDNSLRICTDFRFNSRTISDAYSFRPHISD